MRCCSPDILKISCTFPISSSCAARRYMSWRTRAPQPPQRRRAGHEKPTMSNEAVEQFAKNIYYDRTFDCDAAKILPGEYFVTPKDMMIVTVLGSCVAACIRDRVS